LAEASKKISDGFKAMHPAIPGKRMADISDKIIHDYEGVNSLHSGILPKPIFLLRFPNSKKLFFDKIHEG
jgi:hypothetical protein